MKLLLCLIVILLGGAMSMRLNIVKREPYPKTTTPIYKDSQSKEAANEPEIFVKREVTTSRPLMDDAGADKVDCTKHLQKCFTDCGGVAKTMDNKCEVVVDANGQSKPEVTCNCRPQEGQTQGNLTLRKRNQTKIDRKRNQTKMHRKRNQAKMHPTGKKTKSIEK